ncbi:MAG: Coenzyme F420 hydrogenase/dehydrogenase, beta subunit C-terminal domain [Candidatus Jordarchaeum sp.]|uniref:Coenzyme F420 hydrogenase/dehydrogenase, beta subunit C-terminal domain n=1 Tax=Candidatus Jordarchaeum sp. TaxID=2823881 RepID=UPI00404B00EF
MLNEEEKRYVSYTFPERLLKVKKLENFTRLNQEVVRSGVCTACSTCVSICPEKALVMEDETPKLVGKCTACGICYRACPRTITSIKSLIGDHVAAFIGKAASDKVKGQDGGIVTAILMYAMDTGLIDAAIVTMKSEEEPWKPVAKIVTSSEELLKSSGSVYSHSKTVEALVEAIDKGYRSIAFVGTPCNIDAVAKMQSQPFGTLHLFMKAKILKVGLFCMDSFSYEGLREFFEQEQGISLKSINKMGIAGGKFTINYNGDKTGAWPVKNLDKYRSTSCHYCRDLTSEQADVSVGSVGSAEGYSTILVRTGEAFELLEDAMENGYVVLEPLDREGLQKVLNLARLKKVQMYTERRRHTYVLKYVPTTAGVPEPVKRVGAIPLAEEKTKEKEGIAERALRKLLKVSEARFVDGNTMLQLTLANNSGKTINNMKIRIAHLEDLFETNAWETDIERWYPFEELEFAYPRTKDDKEYLLTISDRQGTILSQKFSVKEIEGKKTEE